MSTIIFSVIHATYGRPKKAAAAMRMWLERAANPEAVQYILCSDHKDPTHFETLRETADIRGFGFYTFVAHPGAGSAAAWNYAAYAAAGELFIQAQDDVEPPANWDLLLLEKMMALEEHEQIPKTLPIFIGVSDGYRTDQLCCTAIMNRARYKQCGREFLHPGYFSVFSDDEVTYRALRDARDGKCRFIEARDLVFLHRHHYHDPNVPMDETYRRENSDEAYGRGAVLFAQRNPEAATDGIRTWG